MSISNATLKHRFDRKIEDLRNENTRELDRFKHEHNREMEALKSDLSQLTDRGIRSNEREYAAIIASWEAFIGAYYQTHACIGGLVSKPDLNKMTPEELEEWLDVMDLSVPNRRYILKEHDRNRALGRVERHKQLAITNKAIWDARTTVRRQSVFIPATLEETFELSLNILNAVWAEQHVLFESPGSLPMTKSLDFLGEAGTKLKDDLRDVVRQHVLRAPGHPGAGLAIPH